MKKYLLIAYLLVLPACNEPFVYFSGGRLAGEQAPLLTLPTSNGVMQIETLPEDPYSVNIGFFVLDGKLYIDPAADRQWYQNILIDPTVRIRFDGHEQVHPMLTIIETDPTILAEFDPARIVLRLEPIN